jgi:hypothetical protein
MIARVSPTPSAVAKQNLDYLSLSSIPHTPPSPVQGRGQHLQQSRLQAQQNQHLFSNFHQKGPSISTGEWEALLGSINGGQLNVYDAIYGGPGLAMSETTSPVVAPPTPTVTTQAPARSTPAGQPNPDWSPDSWDLSAFNLGDLSSAPAHSVMSLSSGEDSLSSGEDMASSEMGVSVGSLEFGNQLLACTGPDGLPILEGLDVSYAL